MPHDPAELSLFFFPFSIMALYAPAVLVALAIVWYVSHRLSRLERRQRKQQNIREKILSKGRTQRASMALRAQRRNIDELARLVRNQLEANKLKMSPYMRQRVSVFIEQAVITVDFDRLYALYAIFLNTSEQHVSPAMELFFEQER